MNLSVIRYFLKMKKRIIYFSLIFVFVIGCKKENYRKPNTTITGIIIDANTQNPIANAKTTLIREKCTLRCFMGGCCGKWKQIVIKNINADDTGYFEMSFFEDNDRAYYLLWETDGYRSLGKPLSELSKTQVNLIKLIPQ